MKRTGIAVPFCQGTRNAPHLIAELEMIPICAYVPSVRKCHVGDANKQRYPECDPWEALR